MPVQVGQRSVVEQVGDLVCALVVDPDLLSMGHEHLRSRRGCLPKLNVTPGFPLARRSFEFRDQAIAANGFDHYNN